MRPAPLASQYRLVFVDEFDSQHSIATDPDTDPQAKWFRKRFFGDPVTPPTMVNITDGIVTLTGTAAQPALLQTAAPVADTVGWQGRVFRGGAYFEARIALGSEAKATETGWPSFWSMAIEHMASRGDAQWSGQLPGYMRFIENDFFEFNPAWNRQAYFATMWEWYGRWELCKRGRWCEVSNTDDSKRAIRLPAGARWTDFHTYGQLWVPARDGIAGYIQNYLDGAPVGPRVAWRSDRANPPSAGAVKFNVIDQQGLVLLLGTGGQSMMVDWVRVWQRRSGRIERR